MVCLNHPDRDAAAVCAACGKPLCSECILNKDGTSYCSESCRQKGTASRDRSGEVISRSAKVDRKARKRFWIVFILFILAAGAGYYFYINNRKTVDRKLNKISKTIRKETGKAIKSGKEAMPKDSRYKREREALVN